MIAVRNKWPSEEVDETFEEKSSRYRATFNNKGIKCFKIKTLGLIDGLGANYQDEEIKRRGNSLVYNGVYINEEIKIRVLENHGNLQRVYVRYEGDNPEKDLRDLFERLAFSGLVLKTFKKVD